MTDLILISFNSILKLYFMQMLNVEWRHLKFLHLNSIQNNSFEKIEHYLRIFEQLQTAFWVSISKNRKASDASIFSQPFNLEH